MNKKPLSQSSSLHTLISQIGLTFRRIRFGGVVGKQTLLGVAGAVALTIIAWRSDPRYAWIIGISAAILLLTTVILNFVYADRHPAEATLEGGEIIAYHHEVIAAKNMLEVPKNSPMIPDPDSAPPQLNPPEAAEE
jgi:hypothetical protein